jgi:hypothetical protein
LETQFGKEAFLCYHLPDTSFRPRETIVSNKPVPQELIAFPVPPPRLWKRVLSMMLLWMVFGTFVGAVGSPFHEGAVRIAAGAIAGMLVLPPLGLVLGLLGGQVRDVLLWGSGGWVLGAMAGLLLGAEPIFLANVGLVMGGTFGATLGSMVRLLKWLASSRIAAKSLLRQ